MNSDRVFAGIDLSAGRQRLTVALLSARLDVRSIMQQSVEEAVDALTSFAEITVAVGGPIRSVGIETEEQAPMGEALRKGALPKKRVAEAELARRGISVRRTPGLESTAPAWMRSAFHLARELRARGVVEEKDARESPRTMIEVHPTASAAVLLGRLPFGRLSLEGRIQRQLILLREKVALPDPMDALEELTAHHILSGCLALEGICRADELDALLAGFTAWRAWSSPEAVTWLGSDSEGWICLPVKEIFDKYPK
jgi:predicted nuclease with RNAse H fold